MGHTDAYTCQNYKVKILHNNVCHLLAYETLKNIQSQAWGAGGMMDETRRAECWSLSKPGDGSKGFVMHIPLTLQVFDVFHNKTFFLITKGTARFLWLQGSSPFHQPLCFGKCFKCIQAQEDNSRAREIQRAAQAHREGHGAARQSISSIHSRQGAALHSGGALPCPNVHLCIIAENNAQTGKSRVPLGWGRRHAKHTKTGKRIKILQAEHSLSKFGFWKVGKNK